MSIEKGYNERLFSGGFRKWLHEARFIWLQRKCRELNLAHATVIELGCFDARSINYLPSRPTRYYGFDANWEGGLDSAREIWRSHDRYVFKIATVPQHLDADGRVDLALSLETLEHIPPALVDGYFKRISELITSTGAFIATVPNEKGPIFLAKYVAKKFITDGRETYSLMEVVNATIGRMSHVARSDHKGFDWAQLRSQLSSHFDVIEVEGVQFPRLPLWANAQIGFLMRPRR
jgi:cyclopropane fatty-acyl-phospholipid synthase-like methyltransferase